MSWSPAQPIVATTSQVHDGTWSSKVDDPEGYYGLSDYVAVAHASATITVTAAPAPAPAPAPSPTATPTTTATPIPTVQYVVVLSEALPAQSVEVQPQLAG
jgi:hypothetical protein